MKSFEQTFLTQQPITQKLLQTIRLIGEYKGKQELYKQQAPEECWKLCGKLRLFKVPNLRYLG